MSANDIQVGGNHYKKNDYQHWDWVIDTNQPYIIACATKYISRWRNKNGLQDLEKAIHYVVKAQEHNILFPIHDSHVDYAFLVQLEVEDQDILYAVINNNFESALELINELIASEPNPHYIKG